MTLRRAVHLAAPALCLLAGLAAPLAAEKPAAKKPQSRPAQTSKSGAQTQTAPLPASPQVQSDQGITVTENYYFELPGIDLSALTPRQKEKFLARVNKELCTCGCPNDTIARCLVNDPKCPTVRGLAEKVLSDVKAGK